MRIRRAAALTLAALALGACSEQIQSAGGGAVTTTSSSSIAAVTVPPDSTLPPPGSTTTTTTTSTSTSTTTSTTTLPPVPTTTACEEVVHIGDSTSVPLFQASGVGGEEFTLGVKYQGVGVSTVYPDNDEARAIIEQPRAEPNALQVAQGVRDHGYHGCWVLMIGTNDAANIANGATPGAEDRIRMMMNVIGDDPVLWVDTVTQRTEDAYRNASMLAWNDDLYRVVADYPNARVFRWYDVVQPEWFRNDGVHYTVEGSAQRAALTAQALVDQFPAAP